jgi:hypothetical protein
MKGKIMEDTKNTREEDTIQFDDIKLFRIAYWAKVVGWVVLSIGVLNLFFIIGRSASIGTYRIALSGATFGDLLVYLSSEIFRLLSTIVSFFLLQGIGEILYLVIDIREQMENKDA